MLSLRPQYPPQVDQSRAIEPQFLNSCSSGRSQTDDTSKINIPGEMNSPFVLPRMKQWDEPSTQGVRRFCARIFVSVAALAGESQI